MHVLSTKRWFQKGILVSSKILVPNSERYLFPARYLFNSEILVSSAMENSTSNVPSEEAVNVDLIEGVYNN